MGTDDKQRSHYIILATEFQVLSSTWEEQCIKKKCCTEIQIRCDALLNLEIALLSAFCLLSSELVKISVQIISGKKISCLKNMKFSKHTAEIFFSSSPSF